MAQESSRKTLSDLLAALDALTVAEIDQVIAAAQEKRAAKQQAGRKALLEEVREKAKVLGLPLHALFEGAVPPRRSAGKGSSALGSRSRAPVRPKYRNPETGETWSGRGSAPGWLRRFEEQGRSREEFATSDEELVAGGV